MNTNSKLSTLSHTQDSFASFPNSQQSLALVKSPRKLDQPTQQQKKSIARIYVEQAWIYFQSKNWHDAVIACKNAIESDRNNADAYKILGNILKLKGRKAEALGVYAKALELNPNSAAIYANLGSFYAEQKKWQEALDYYQQAVILDPQFAGAYRSLAQVWEELGDTNQALECLCQAVNLEPEKLTAQEYFNFGQELYQQDKLKEASIFYIRGIELNPQAEAELTQLVKILEELEEWQQAVIYYHKLISLSDNDREPNNPGKEKPIRSLLSRAKAAKAKQASAKPPELAGSPFNDAQKRLPQVNVAKNQSPGIKRPDSAVSWNNLGSLYAQKQQWAKAVSCYQEAIALDPNLSKSYRNLARVYSKTGKKEEAALYWYESFILEPNTVQPEEHFNLANDLVELDRTDKAIACLRLAVEQKPDFDRAYLLLGKLYEQQGEMAEAKACYDKVANKNK